MNKALEPEEVIRRLQEQNSPGLFVGSWAKWIGQRPTKTGAIRVALKCPIRANKAIQQGLILDYEILRVRQYIPTKRYQKCKQIGHTRAKCTKNPRPMGKTFYKEKETTVSTTFQSELSQPMDVNDTTRGQEEEWTLVEGTQKRKMANSRGRLRLF